MPLPPLGGGGGGGGGLQSPYSSSHGMSGSGGSGMSAGGGVIGGTHTPSKSGSRTPTLDRIPFDPLRSTPLNSRPSSPPHPHPLPHTMSMTSSVQQSSTAPRLE